MIDITDIIIDPELEGLLPPLAADERAGLLASVIRDKFNDPIIVWLNHFANREAVIEWMLHRQLSRRNLTDFQRAEIALKLKPIIAAKAAANKSAAGGDRKSGASKSVSRISDEPIRVDVEVAKLAGIGKDTLRKVEKVLAEGSEETKRAATAGEITISAAHKATVRPVAISATDQKAKAAVDAASDAPSVTEKPKPKGKTQKRINSVIGGAVRNSLKYSRENNSFIASLLKCHASNIEAMAHFSHIDTQELDAQHKWTALAIDNVARELSGINGDDLAKLPEKHKAKLAEKLKAMLDALSRQAGAE